MNLYQQKVSKIISPFRNLSFIAVLSDDGECNEKSVTYSRSVKWYYQTSSFERQTLLLWQLCPSQNCSLLKEKFTPKMETYLQTLMFFEPICLSFVEHRMSENVIIVHMTCALFKVLQKIYVRNRTKSWVVTYTFFETAWGCVNYEILFSNCFFTFLTHEKHETWSCQQINK